MLRLGLAGTKGQMLVKVLKWIFSEAQDGKDIADRIIGTEKGQVRRWVKCGNDAVTASDLCEALASMSSLPGDHKTFVLEPTAAELEQEIPLKGGKGLNAKHFSLYHEIEFKYHENWRVPRPQCQRAVSVWAQPVVSSGDPNTNEKNCKGAKLGSTSECDTGKCARGRCFETSGPKESSWILCQITDQGTHVA